MKRREQFKRGIFLSDIHIPENISLAPVFDFIADFEPHVVILGGDIVDCKEMHGVDQLPASSFRDGWYWNDVEHARAFLKKLADTTKPDTFFVYLLGNHEDRYDRFMRRHEAVFGKDKYLFSRDAEPEVLRSRIKWIPYATYKSYYRIGDCVFTHGTIWPDIHAKKYALDFSPNKCVYGHLHHFQAYTTRKPYINVPPRYAVTGGCLSNTMPEWKRGAPNQWVNGFVSFITDNRITTPTVHLIENGRFNVGARVYR